MKNTIQFKKKKKLRKFIKTREMATDHEITTLNLMSDMGILGIDTRNIIVFQIVIIPCRDSLVGRSVRMKIWMSLVQLRSALNNPRSWPHFYSSFFPFLFAPFTFLNQISLFLHLHTKEELFFKSWTDVLGFHTD